MVPPRPPKRPPPRSESHPLQPSTAQSQSRPSLRSEDDGSPEALSLPTTNNVSIIRFHEYLSAAFLPGELCSRLSNRAPANRRDVQVLQLAASYANVWVSVDTTFQAIVRSRGVDFCTLTAGIHFVLSKLSPYEYFDSSSDSDYEDYAMCTAEVDSNNADDVVPHFVDPRIGSTMGRMVGALEETKNHARNSAAKRSSKFISRLNKMSHATPKDDARTFVEPSQQTPRRVPPPLETSRLSGPPLPPRPSQPHPDAHLLERPKLASMFSSKSIHSSTTGTTSDVPALRQQSATPTSSLRPSATTARFAEPETGNSVRTPGYVYSSPRPGVERKSSHGTPTAGTPPYEERKSAHGTPTAGTAPYEVRKSSHGAPTVGTHPYEVRRSRHSASPSPSGTHAPRRLPPRMDTVTSQSSSTLSHLPVPHLSLKTFKQKAKSVGRAASVSIRPGTSSSAAPTRLKSHH